MKTALHRLQRILNHRFCSAPPGISPQQLLGLYSVERSSTFLNFESKSRNVLVGSVEHPPRATQSSEKCCALNRMAMVRFSLVTVPAFPSRSPRAVPVKFPRNCTLWNVWQPFSKSFGSSRKLVQKFGSNVCADHSG